jgi:hypothetical protein
MQYRPKRVFFSSALDSLLWQTFTWPTIRRHEKDLVHGDRIVIQRFLQTGDVNVQY